MSLPTSSASGDLDTELFSISSGTENAIPGENHSIGYQLVRRVVSRLLILSWGEPADVGGATLTTTSNPTIQRAPSVSTRFADAPAGQQSHKRKRQNNGDNSGDNSDEDDHRARRRKPLSLSDSTGRPRFLACPFWKLDPPKHWECFQRKHDTISRVKQHLARRHTPEHYCQRCYAQFASKNTLQDHLRSHPCLLADGAKLDGISAEESRSLTRKSRSRGNVQAQWYEIWEILFGEKPRPASVYIELDLSEEFNRLRDFSQQQGVSILLDEMRSIGMIPPAQESETRLQGALQRGLDAMFQLFRRSDPQYELAPRPPGSSTYTDSGVAIRSSDSQVPLGPPDTIASSAGNLGSRIQPTSVSGPELDNTAEVSPDGEGAWELDDVRWDELLGLETFLDD